MRRFRITSTLAVVVSLIVIPLGLNYATASVVAPAKWTPWIWGALVLSTLAAVAVSMKTPEPPEITRQTLDDATARLAEIELDRTVAERRGRAQESGLGEARWRSRPGQPDLFGQSPLDLGSHRPEELMADAFQQLPSGRLSIIGAPGSGKSTLALALVEGLLTRRQKRDPVPVLVSLADWNPRTEPPEAWLSLRLAVLFPFLSSMGSLAVSTLVAAGRILPVLDGLDELPAELQTAALARLSGSRLARRPYVLTSRTDAFDRAAESTTLPPDMAVIELHPASPDALARYLRRHQTADDQRWEPVLTELAQHPAGLVARTLSMPWAAYAARTAYADAGTDPRELLDDGRFGSSAALEGHLLNVWLDSLMRHRELRPSASRQPRFDPAATRRWLGWLAGYLRDTDKRQLAWWDLAQALPSPLRNAGYWPMLAVLLAPIDLKAAIVALWTTGIAVWPDQRREETPRQLAWAPGRRIVIGISGALLATVGLVAPLSLQPQISVSTWIAWLAAAGLALVILALVDAAVVPITDPGGTLTQQVRRDRRAILVRATAAGVATGAGTAAVVDRTLPHAGWTVAVAAATTFVIVMAASAASGKFRLARIWLAARGQLPWRLSAFMSYANSIGVLRSDAGRFEFRHAALQDMLAGPKGRPAGRPAIKPSLAQAIVDEVFVLPEVAMRLARQQEVRPQPSKLGGPREDIEQRVRLILAERPEEVLDRGREDRIRFRQAHGRLVRAVGRPGWTRLAWAYQIVLWLSLVLSLLGAALTFLPRWGPALIAGAALVAAATTASRAVQYLNWRVTMPIGVSLPRLRAAAWLVLVAAVAGAAIAVPVDVAREPALMSATLVIAVCWPPAALAWLLSRPHERIQQRLAADEPAYWPDAPGTEQLRTAAEQARQDWITALARNGVMPFLRDKLGAGTSRFSTTLLPFDASRLGGVSRVDQLVQTPATRQLDRYLRDLSSISVGISGSRGAGKSTVLQRFCVSQFTRTTEDLLLLVPAPTAYDRREFLIHLFAEICERVVGEDDAVRPQRRRLLTAAWRALPGVLVAGGLLTTALAWSWSSVVSAAHLVTMSQRTAIIVGGLVITGLGLMMALLMSRSGGRASQRSATTQQSAIAQLNRLRYQLTTSTSRVGKIGLPRGVEFSTTAGTQRTEQMRSYPELVADFRELLHQVALERRSLGRRVIIGIDELDKIDSPADAERFLNDLKVIFGVPGCFFLVAVSDDALAAFDRRSLSVRTTFDSAFDQIITVPPLGLDEARELLSLRGVSLPEPYLWLCHALSGGLPRDLLRSVLQLATASADQVDDLPTLARELIGHDVRSVFRAQLFQAEVATDPARPAVTAWLARAADSEATSAALERTVTSPPAVEPGSVLASLVSQSCSYACYAATLLHAFTEDTPKTVDWLSNTDRSKGVDLLASARAHLATSPDSAMTRVQRFRDEAPFLTPLA
ncbi:NACHT domain-containing protein [Paractinoplanes durhamensis]|uniref:NACHT domain-containing protein n=1 Tax=Paractinoplanes durhamensis TaxID=113563 RepID=A0ABQ3Z398_9ACTN|nr:NACHT domain-containing protein [Actinoplanes durhamensis]GIE04308.1 hypothetical protein Adu01nite_56580 [Actinoplanes durhamensis]